MLVLQVGAFASQFVGHLAERDLLSALPPLFVALVAWCRHGGAARGWTAVVALAVAAPAVALPIGRLATNEAMLDGFSTIALRKLAEHASTRTLEVAWPLAVVSLVAVPVLCASRPRRRASAVAVTAATLVVLGGVAQSDVRRASAADERWWFGDTSPRWIDGSADGPVTWIQAGTANWGGAWKTAFWNRRVERIVRFAGTGTPGHFGAPLVAAQPDGRLLTTDGRTLAGRYVAAPVELVLDGEEVARTGPSGDLAGIALWRLGGGAAAGRVAARPRAERRSAGHRGHRALGLRRRPRRGDPARQGADARRLRRARGGAHLRADRPEPGEGGDGRGAGAGGRCRISIASRALVGITQITRTR